MITCNSLPDFLRDELIELNETLDIDRGQFELVNICLSFFFWFGLCWSREKNRPNVSLCVTKNSV